ncbi:hypothetical protein NIES2107_65200 [Nostoc carneum NIES-2107]|nr:hypothetical protein NIES2107_65200 [Nostoc carneum NIES-2107]
MSVKKSNTSILKKAIASLLVLRVMLLGIHLNTEIQEKDLTIEDFRKITTELIAIFKEASNLKDKHKQKKRQGKTKQTG